MAPAAGLSVVDDVVEDAVPHLEDIIELLASRALGHDEIRPVNAWIAAEREKHDEQAKAAKAKADQAKADKKAAKKARKAQGAGPTEAQLEAEVQRRVAAVAAANAPADPPVPPVKKAAHAPAKKVAAASS